MPTKDIEILQFEKLRKIVSYAYAKVPYYKMKFDEAGFSPEKFRNIEDIEKIPILTKEDIQKNTERFISVDFRKDDLLKNSTGGSTGYPLIFYHSRQYQNWATADIHRHFTWCGHQVGERFALLWGSDYDYNRVNKLRRDIENYIKNWLWINTFNIREAEFAEHIVRLKQFRPVFLIGYASSLHMLARILKKNSEKIESIDAVESSAELLYPRQRKDIESILNCRVFDRYGCREVGNIAHECKEHKGLHISSENNFVEFLDKYGQSVGYGKEGRVVVTNLNNFAFPFIRYDVGDIGSPLGKECSCGINLPMMKPISGRKSDIIITPEGNHVHGEYFTHLFYGKRSISQFQVVQDKRNHLLVKYIPSGRSENLKSDLLDIKKHILRDLDNSFDVEFEQCNNIPVSQSGKYRFTISKIKSNFL